MQTRNIPLPEIWKSCNKIRAAIFRFGINLYDYFKPLDPKNNNLVSENQFISVFGKQLRSLIGLSDQEISELADYFKIQDGRIFYRQLCDVIHKSVPDFSENPPFASGLEWEDPMHENNLGPTEERKIEIIMTKIAASVNKRQLILKPFFQEYELLSKNCGSITIAHFGRILYFLGISLGAEEFNLLVKKYVKDSCTISYNAFLARLDAITRYWEENGFTDLGGDLLDQFPGRLITAELPKLPRPEIGRVPTEKIFGPPKTTHPVMERKPPPEDLEVVMKRIQKYVFTYRIQIVDYFQQYDGLNSGRITCNQFKRGINMLGARGLYLSEPELWQLIVFYRDPNDSDRVCWRTFTDDVDQVFTIKELEKWPEVQFDQQDIMDFPRTGQISWIDVEPNLRDLCEETLGKLKKKIVQRSLNLKSEFKNYDKNRIGHVSRSQFRQCLLTNGILLAVEELSSLEKRFIDDIGFNYFSFLNEIEASTLEEPLYNEYVKEVRKVNCPEPKQIPTICEKDIVMILAKIKAKVVRERIDLLPFFRDHDGHNERVINKCNFLRALDVGRFDLSNPEVETIMKVFAAPGRNEYIDYIAFVRTINEAFTQPDLERAPLIIPAPHYPSETDPRNFLNFNERHTVAIAIEKLAALPDANLEELFSDYDKERCGSITKEQFQKALAIRNMLHLISTTERNLICKAFSYYRGLRDEVDYRAFLRALNILQVNLKRKPV